MMMIASIRLNWFLPLLIFVVGCGTNKKIKPNVQVSHQSVSDSASLVSLFEAQHADLFFPFSYEPLSFESQELQEGEVYTLILMVKASLADSIASYKKHMEVYGWRNTIAVSTQLLFEKPHARCIITIRPRQRSYVEIIMIYTNLMVDEQYHLIN